MKGKDQDFQGLMTTDQVFISYSRADQTLVRKLADAIVAAGLDVWWDRELVAGDRFRAVIEERLNAARCVVVVWSRTSVQSDWVLGEADTARRRGLMLPVVVDDCKVPIEFRQLHQLDLTAWAEDDDPAPLAALLEQIQRRLDPGFVPVPLSDDKGPWWRNRTRRRWVVRSGVALVAAGLAAMLYLPTKASEVACNAWALCLSDAPRVETFTPLGQDLFAVTLKNPPEGPVITTDRAVTLFVPDTGPALYLGADPPLPGQYLPGEVATEDAAVAAARRLGNLPPQTIVAALDHVPNLPAIDRLSPVVIDVIGSPKEPKNCPEVIAEAQKIFARQSFGATAEASEIVRIGLTAEAMSCDMAKLPADW